MLQAIGARVDRLTAWTPARWALVLLVVGGVGGCDSRECADAMTAARRAATNSDWQELRTQSFQAKAFCNGRHADEVAAWEKQVKTHDAEAAAAASAKARAEAEALERSTVETFPDTAEEARAMLKKARAAIAKKSFETAAPLVKSTRFKLDEAKGTSVEKSEAWRDLDAQTRELEAKVKPYLDQVDATLAEANRLLAEETAADRRDGVKYTRKNYVASPSLEKVKKAIEYAAAGDKEGYALFVQSDPDVILLKDGVRVVPIERTLAGYVRVRLKGTLVELWTLKEAIRDP